MPRINKGGSVSEELIVRHCAPTLAGIKTGNLFACSFPSVVEMRRYLRRINGIFAGKGLRILPLRFQNKRALIYVYRPAKLSADLQQNTACLLLRQRGYTPEAPQSCILQLIRRLESDDVFPHEIGLFLGYPPEDVHGFIENKAQRCKCVGGWKVYGDAQAAERRFAKYKKCTDIYCALHAKGNPIERLTVKSK